VSALGPNGERCSSCYFWQAGPEFAPGTRGICRALPAPQPERYASDWCGMYYPKHQAPGDSLGSTKVSRPKWELQ